MNNFFFLNQDAIRQINKMLGIPASGHEQDWELEYANPDRRSEIFDLLKRSVLSKDIDVGAALAALYIASADDAITAGRFLEQENKEAILFFRNEPALREMMHRFWFTNGEPMNADQIKTWLI